LKSVHVLGNLQLVPLANLTPHGGLAEKSRLLQGGGGVASRDNKSVPRHGCKACSFYVLSVLHDGMTSDARPRPHRSNRLRNLAGTRAGEGEAITGCMQDHSGVCRGPSDSVALAVLTPASAGSARTLPRPARTVKAAMFLLCSYFHRVCDRCEARPTRTSAARSTPDAHHRHPFRSFVDTDYPSGRFRDPLWLRAGPMVLRFAAT
jgi:hypothetical protein